MQKLSPFSKLTLDTDATIPESLSIMALFHLHLTLVRCFTGSIDSRHPCSWEKSFSMTGWEGITNFSKLWPILAQHLNAPIRKLKAKIYFTTAKRSMRPNQQKHGFPRRFGSLEHFIHSPAVTIALIWSTFARQSGQVSRC